MTKDEFDTNLVRVAVIQRQAGWSETSIEMYASEHRAIFSDPSCVLSIGAGLACDNTRFGVFT